MEDEFTNLEESIIIESEELLEYPEPQLPFDDTVVIVNDTALEIMRRQLQASLHAEAGGIMLGNLNIVNDILFVEITDVLLAQNVEASFGSLKFGHDTWIDFDQRKRKHFPEKKTVGWYHSHLGIGIFFSSYDRTVHKIAFPLPWLVGMVIDPILGEQGVFRWQGDDIVRCPFLLRKKKLQRSVNLPLSHSVSNRISSLNLFAQARPTFADLAQTFRRLQLSMFNQEKTSHYYYANQVELLTILENLSEINKEEQQLLKKLNKQLKTELLLSIESMQPILTLLTPHTQVVAFNGGLIARSAPNQLLSVMIEDELKYKVWTLQTNVTQIAPSHDSLLMLTNSGTILQMEYRFNDALEGSESLPVAEWGAIDEQWCTENKLTEIKSCCSINENIFFLIDGRIWQVILEQDSKPLIPKLAFHLQKYGEAINFVLDSSGGLFFTVPSEGKILKLDHHGKLVYELAVASDVSLSLPKALALYKDSLVVLDSINYRLVFFEMDNGTYQKQYHFSSSLIATNVNNVISDGQELYLHAGEYAFRVVE